MSKANGVATQNAKIKIGETWAGSLPWFGQHLEVGKTYNVAEVESIDHKNSGKKVFGIKLEGQDIELRMLPTKALEGKLATISNDEFVFIAKSLTKDKDNNIVSA